MDNNVLIYKASFRLANTIRRIMLNYITKNAKKINLRRHKTKKLSELCLEKSTINSRQSTEKVNLLKFGRQIPQKN